MSVNIKHFNILYLSPSLYLLINKYFKDFLATILICLATNWRQMLVFYIYVNLSKSLQPLLLLIFSTTVFIFFNGSTRTCCSHIISIIYIYNIIDISMFLELGNIYIISIYCIIFIINISLLWTN